MLSGLVRRYSPWGEPAPVPECGSWFGTCPDAIDPEQVCDRMYEIALMPVEGNDCLGAFHFCQSVLAGDRKTSVEYTLRRHEAFLFTAAEVAEVVPCLMNHSIFGDDVAVTVWPVDL